MACRRTLTARCCGGRYTESYISTIGRLVLFRAPQPTPHFPHYTCASTAGVDFKIRTIGIDGARAARKTPLLCASPHLATLSLAGKTVKLQIWDTAGSRLRKSQSAAALALPLTPSIFPLCRARALSNYHLFLLPRCGRSAGPAREQTARATHPPLTRRARHHRCLRRDGCRLLLQRETRRSHWTDFTSRPLGASVRVGEAVAARDRPVCERGRQKVAGDRLSRTRRAEIAWQTPTYHSVPSNRLAESMPESQVGNKTDLVSQRKVETAAAKAIAPPFAPFSPTVVMSPLRLLSPSPVRAGVCRVAGNALPRDVGKEREVVSRCVPFPPLPISEQPPRVDQQRRARIPQDGIRDQGERLFKPKARCAGSACQAGRGQAQPVSRLLLTYFEPSGRTATWLARRGTRGPVHTFVRKQCALYGTRYTVAPHSIVLHCGVCATVVFVCI